VRDSVKRNVIAYIYVRQGTSNIQWCESYNLWSDDEPQRERAKHYYRNHRAL